MISASGPEPSESPRNPQFSLPSLAESVWKQKTAILSVWLCVTVIALIVTRFLPRVYEAEALVLLESQRIPHDFVSPTTVRADLWERLSSLDQRVLSHTQLLALIESFGLYRDEAEKLNQEELVARMREDIHIELEQGLGASDRPPAFRVAYQGERPEEVAQVANRLAYLFIEQDLRERSVEAVGTAEFLESRLEAARHQLEAQESRLSRYKSEHNGELPEQEGALIGTLARLQTQLSANQETLRQAQQDKFFAKNALEVALASAGELQALSRRPNAVFGATNPEASAILQDPEQRALRELRAELVSLRQRYTKSHPEVLKAEEALRKLEVEVKATAKNASGPGDTNNAKSNSDSAAVDGQGLNPALVTLLEPEMRRREEQIDQLQTQLRSLDNRIEMLHSSQDRLLASIEESEHRIQQLPIREQEIAALVRDYEITKTNYQSLLKKRMDADLAMEMEKRQKSEKFVLLEPARVPETPVKPKVAVIGGVGSLLGLILGLVFGAGREIRNNVFLGEWELPKELNVMGRVPHFSVGTVERTALSFRRLVIASSILTLLVILGIGVVRLQGHWPVF